MPLYDVSLPLRDKMPLFPGDPAFKIEPFFQRVNGDPFNLAVLSLGTHSGTHVDPPSHYFDGGATVDQIPLEVLVGPGVVVDMRGRTEIDLSSLKEASLYDRTRVLFKTDNGPKLRGQFFHEDYVHLTEDAAQYLVARSVMLVGIDYLSIERYGNWGAPVHRALLAANVLVVEAVDLLDVPPGPCEIYCLPLRIEGGDGAPARVLIQT